MLINLITESYWFIIPAFLLLQISLGNTLSQRNLLILFCGTLAACAALIAGLLAKVTLALALFLFGTSFLAVFLGWLYIDIFIIVVAMIFAGMLSAGMPTTLSGSVERFGLIFFGMLFALLINSLIWNRRLKNNIKNSFITCLEKLNQLQKILFTSYLERNYTEKHYEYEKKLHQQNHQFLKALKKVRVLTQGNPNQSFHEIFNGLERSHETVMALGSLRYRVTDPATFEIISAELKSISKALTDYLLGLIYFLLNRKNTATPAAFSSHIYALEEVNLHALQVASPEPMVFSFFIQQLYSLQAELDHLKNEILKINSKENSK